MSEVSVDPGLDESVKHWGFELRGESELGVIDSRLDFVASYTVIGIELVEVCYVMVHHIERRAGRRGWVSRSQAVAFFAVDVEVLCCPRS